MSTLPSICICHLTTRRMLSALHCKSREEHQERCATEDAANCMKPAPLPEEAACFFRPRVEFLALQAFVGRQNPDKRQGNSKQQEQPPNQPSRSAFKSPSDQCRKRADQGQRNLHQGASPVAGSPLCHRESRTARNSCWLFHEVDVQRS